MIWNRRHALQKSTIRLSSVGIFHEIGDVQAAEISKIPKGHHEASVVSIIQADAAGFLRIFAGSAWVQAQTFVAVTTFDAGWSTVNSPLSVNKETLSINQFPNAIPSLMLHIFSLGSCMANLTITLCLSMYLNKEMIAISIPSFRLLKTCKN